MSATKSFEGDQARTPLDEATDMASEMKHPYITLDGYGRYYLLPEMVKARNRAVAKELTRILELPITRPIPLDRQGYPAGVENPFLDTRQ